jgi:hypothetical protein
MAESDDSRERKLAAKRAWYAANREKEAASKKAWYQKNKEWFRAYQRALYAADPSRWNASNPRVAFAKQKQHAKLRGIPFLLTFEEWSAIWHESGKFADRGRCKGQYVMARFGDRGGYEIGNVYIITHSQNVSDGSLGKPKPKRRRATHGSTAS